MTALESQLKQAQAQIQELKHAVQTKDQKMYVLFASLLPANLRAFQFFAARGPDEAGGSA